MAFAPARRSGPNAISTQRERPSSAGASGSQQLPKRRRKIDAHQTPSLILERALGLSTVGPCGLAMHPLPDIPLVAYPAGGILTLYNHRRNRQTAFLIAASAIPTPNVSGDGDMPEHHYTAGSLSQGNSGKKVSPGTAVKPISCVAFSTDGSVLAAGESGHQPRILVWDYNVGAVLSELQAHKFGVLSIAFSPNQKFLVSVGHQHDGYIYVWNWRNGQKLAYSRIGSKIYSVAFDDTGQFFVTSGFRHFKFWYMDSTGNLPKTQKSSQMSQKNQPQLLEGKFGVVGEHKNSTFADVACQRSSDGDLYTYSITEKGILVLFTEERVMEKWVDLKVAGGHCIAVVGNIIICGCSEGVIRIFETVTLKYVTTLPKPHSRGQDIAHSVGSSYKVANLPNAVFPHVVSLKADSNGEKITAIYSDHSLFIWDIKEIKHIGKYRSFLYHSDCVWGVEVLEHGSLPALGHVPSDEPSPAFSDPPQTPLPPPLGLPPNTFVTYSSDGTIRCWNIDMQETVNSYFRRNIYSKELIKILFIEDAVQSSNVTPCDGETSPAQNSGIRSLKISEDGKMMAAGDRMGNIRIFELENFSMVKFMEAHDAEILAMDFCHSDAPGSPHLLATAGRDRMIHVFEADKSFELMQTLDDHSSSITALRFSEHGQKLISSAADKSVIFRALIPATQDRKTEYAPYHNAIGRATVFDIDVDRSQQYLAAVSQDRRLNIYATDTGKPLRSYRPDSVDDPAAEGGSSALIKVAMDPSGTFAVTCGSDKCIRVFEFSSGICVAKVVGHADLVTGVKFTRDCSRIISTSADGCILIWRVATDMAKFMRDRLRRGGSSTPIGHESTSSSPIPYHDDEDGNSVEDSRKEVAQNHRPQIDGPTLLRPPLVGGIISAITDRLLPSWARSSKDMPDFKSTIIQDAPAPRGRWASRVENDGVVLFSEASETEKPMAKFSDLFSRRFSIEDVQPSPEVGPSTVEGGDPVNDTNVPSNKPLEDSDIIVHDFDSNASDARSLLTQDALEDDYNDNEFESDHEVDDAEATIFVESSDAPNESNEYDSSYIISEERQDQSSTVAEPLHPANETADEQDNSVHSEPELEIEYTCIDDQVQDQPDSHSLEDYLLQPVDQDVSRHSISSEYVRRRTVLQGDEAFPRTLETFANNTEPSELVTEVAEMTEIDRVSDAAHQTAHRNTDSALDRDAIMSAVAHATNHDYAEEKEDDENLDLQALLEQLNTVSDKSIAAFKRLESRNGKSSAEVNMANEIRRRLLEISTKIATAVSDDDRKLEVNDEREKSNNALLEKYSDMLVCLVREKLAQ